MTLFKNKISYKIVLVLAFISIFSGLVPVANTATVNAATGDYTLLAPLPCIEGNGVTCGGNGKLIEQFNFKNYLQYVFNLFIAIAAVLAVFMIVWGGFEYMTSVAPNVKSDGLAKARHAIEGLLLILCSWLLLSTINPAFVNIDMSGVKPLKVTKTAWGSYMDKLTQLTNEMRQANVDSQGMVQQANALNKELSQLQDESDANYCGEETDSTGNYTGTSPTCQRLNSQIKAKQDQVSQTFQQSVMTRVKADIPMYENIIATNPQGPLDTLSGIQKARTDYIKQISDSAYGGNPDPQKIQEINQTYDKLTQAAAQKEFQSIIPNQASLSNLEDSIKYANQMKAQNQTATLNRAGKELQQMNQQLSSITQKTPGQTQLINQINQCLSSANCSNLNSGLKK